MSDEEGDRLSNVRVAVLGEEEFGQTRSRANGEFDLAVNGGGLVTLTFDRAGFLPVQREVDTSWQDFERAEDVVMTRFDGRATSIDLTETGDVQVAQGNPVTDAERLRGRRRCCSPPGHAGDDDPAGRQGAGPWTTLHVRAHRVHGGRQAARKPCLASCRPTPPTPTPWS